MVLETFDIDLLHNFLSQKEENATKNEKEKNFAIGAVSFVVKKQEVNKAIVCPLSELPLIFVSGKKFTTPSGFESYRPEQRDLLDRITKCFFSKWTKGLFCIEYRS